MSHICTEAGCGAIFSRPYRLKQHLLKHEGKKPFKCTEDGCGKEYSNQSHLRRHKLKVHEGVKVEKKKCPMEGCTCEVLVNNMTRHLKTYHDISKKVICSVCKATFLKKTHLKAHMYEHTGVKSFNCEHCSLSFVTISEYKKHKRNHKSYTCTCGEVFYRWTVYLKHKKESDKHKGESARKFTCEVCKKTFYNKNTYEEHLKSHTENRDVLKCPMEGCDRVYYYKKNLVYHVERFHLKTKEYVKRKIPYQRKENKNKNPIRKDKGTMKKSTALKLSNLAVPYEAEKRILNGETIEAENISDFVDNSDAEQQTKTSNIVTIDSSEISDAEVPFKKNKFLEDDTDTSEIEMLSEFFDFSETSDLEMCKNQR